MNKVVSSIQEAVANIPDGAVIAIGGFLTCGVPRDLLWGIVEKGVKNITLCCGAGPLVGCPDIAKALVDGNQLKTIIDCYPLNKSATKGLKDPVENAIRDGKIELVSYPQGTLAEMYRSAGAGIPAFYVTTGVGSMVEEAVISSYPQNCRPRETRIINGQKCILEYALQPDFALVHAFTGDYEGNLRYAATARNFNQVMASAAKVTIAEVENLVAPGELAADDVQTPQIYVKKVIKIPRPSFVVGI